MIVIIGRMLAEDVDIAAALLASPLLVHPR